MLRVKIFDADDEVALEEEMNDFLEDINESQLKDIQFQVAGTGDEEEVWTGYSALILYRE